MRYKLITGIVERIKVWLALRSTHIPFRTWLELEEIKSKIVNAVREKGHTFPELICLYLSTALRVSSRHFENKPWEEVIGLFIIISSKTIPSHTLPLIHKQSSSKKEKDAWDYDGRTWYLYSNLIAQTYGWTLEYIAQLDVDNALSLIQEILTDEQLEREFLWSMSEKSVTYNSKTKTSRFNPLPRPYWMMPELKPIKIIIMPRNMLPIGEVEQSAIPEPFRPKPVSST